MARNVGSYLSKLANVTYLLPLQGAEVGGDAAIFEVYHSSERLVQERSNGEDRKVTGFCLSSLSVSDTPPMVHDKLTARVWIIALNPISTLPLPIISVTSEGSLGSRMATLMPSSLK